MKNLHFIVQAKGGVGKSLFTYLLGLKNQQNDDSLFVDVDSSTQTSTRQLKFLGENRTETLSLLNEKDVLVRDKFIAYLESLVDAPFKDIYFDFGAPESEQFPALIERDLPFHEFLEELNFNANFHVVIGGGGAYAPSIEYFQKLLGILPKSISINVWESITTFNNFPHLAQELNQNCAILKIPKHRFGDFDPSSNLGGQILSGIRLGYSLNDYQTGARLRLKRELSENFNKGLYETN